MAKILAVDDSKTMLSFFSSTLRSAGHSVVTAPNGPNAIFLAQRERPDVVLMDYQMPGISGKQAAAILADEGATRHIPVIFVSSENDREELASIVALPNVIGYLMKPLSGEDLLSRIAKVLAAQRLPTFNPAWDGIERRVRQAIKWTAPERRNSATA